ncbi:ParM/StbA family protein [Tolypothrix sp. VBCCA 56010]|uniref:ParM/StbA family protein n=1 Tax=Tolypothrix sp. VBCCA 56010 TaxID=3137731 RepID=UPI003D7D773A
MIATQPMSAENSQCPLLIPTGVDTGAGLVKIVFGSGASQTRVRTPSKVLEIREELHDNLSSPEGGHFFYHDGDRKDLIGREFLTGTLANWKAPTTHIKLSDDPALKVEYSLHTLLGALATLPYQPHWNLHLILSIHNAKIFKELLTTKIAGVHTVSFGGKNNSTSQINLTVARVLPEGAGSYSYCVAANPPLIDRTGTAIALDLGTSTVIATVFAPGGSIIHRQVLEVGGCIDLLSAIATDSELIKILGTGKSGSVETIRIGIENTTFGYGTRDFNFRSIYARHLKAWLRDRLRLVAKEIEEWRDASQSFVAWGGGVEMPGVSKMLADKKIVAVSNGSWANAIGLQRMSSGILGRTK